ncbi:MAG: queF [Gammaproteobacteria bacterium]|jgi:7-cyano-7-deazaguanine reductase|nr:queF [Gammaproteobacteria bacterium]
MNPVSTQNQNDVTHSELGKKTVYPQTYNAAYLYPISRADKRLEIGIDPDVLPFVGFDCWNHYEVSWLNEKGKPMVAIAEIIYDCNSLFIIESKSLKLYFNSFNQFKFKSVENVIQTIQKDLEPRLKTSVTVTLHPLNSAKAPTMKTAFEGICLDELDIECSTYNTDPNFLYTENKLVKESVYSDLLKSNCLVTHQPDWGSVQISYEGNKIDHAGLLRYIVSYRNHNEFHEQCIERIFVDILKRCQPKKLTVYGRYTRRGGLDINPYRSTHGVDFKGLNYRLPRQ